MLALRFLIGDKSLGMVGLNPNLGKEMLIRIVQNHDIPFTEKEAFAFYLAETEKSFIAFYMQSVKTMYLDNENESAGSKLIFAERLAKLGCISDQELEIYQKAAQNKRVKFKSGFSIQFTNGVIITNGVIK